MFHVLILVIYKYTNFILGFTSIHIDLALPVGLSFFTFSAISYLADVYLGKSQAQNNILSLALYLTVFGKVSMGPIVQYHDMEKELFRFKKVRVLEFGEAFQRIMKGLAKKGNTRRSVLAYVCIFIREYDESRNMAMCDCVYAADLF